MRKRFFEALEARTSYSNRYRTLFVRGQVLLLSVGVVLGLVKWILTKDWLELPFHLALYAVIGTFVSGCLSILLYLSDLYSRRTNKGREESQRIEVQGDLASLREAVDSTLRDLGVVEIVQEESEGSPVRATTLPSWRSSGEIIEVVFQRLEGGKVEITIESSGSSDFDFGKHAWNVSQIIDRLNTRIRG